MSWLSEQCKQLGTRRWGWWNNFCDIVQCFSDRDGEQGYILPSLQVMPVPYRNCLHLLLLKGDELWRKWINSSFWKSIANEAKNLLEILGLTILCTGHSRMHKEIILGELQLARYTLYKETVCYYLVFLSSRKQNMGCINKQYKKAYTWLALTWFLLETVWAKRANSW